MKNLNSRFILTLILATSLALAAALLGYTPTLAASCQSNGSGNWSDTLAWTNCGGVIPQAGDSVQIQSGHIITLDTDPNSGLAGVTVDVGAILDTSSARNLQGNSVTVNGTFRLNQGGWVNNGTFIYGPTGTLEFANTSGAYGFDDSHVYWPSSNSPVSVNVSGSGGLDMNSTTRTLNGMFQISSGVQESANLTIAGSLQINSGGYIDTVSPIFGSNASLVYNNGAGYTLGAEWPASNGPGIVTISNGGGLNMNGATRTVSGVIQTNGPVTNGVLTIGGSGTLRINAGGSIGFAPTYTSGALLLYNTGGSYNRSFEWSATSGAGYPHHVQVSNSTTLNLLGSGSAIRRLAGNLTIDLGSTLTMGAMTHELDVRGNLVNNGTLTLGTSGNLYLFGNWTNTGTFNPNQRTVWFQGASAQTINGNSTTFARLQLNNANGLTLNTDISISPTAAIHACNPNVCSLDVLAGDLNTGSNTVTLGSFASCSGTSTTGDVVGNVQRTAIVAGTTYCFGHRNNQISFLSQGTLPSALTVSLSKTQPAGFSYAVTRAYTITPTGGSGFSATVRLRYLDSELNGNSEVLLKLWRFGGVWVNLGASTVDTTNNYVERSGVISFSPWAISSQTPTAVTLRAAAAQGSQAFSPALFAAAFSLMLVGGGLLAALRRKA